MLRSSYINRRDGKRRLSQKHTSHSTHLGSQAGKTCIQAIDDLLYAEGSVQRQQESVAGKLKESLLIKRANIKPSVVKGCECF
jgi:hypothetical protein